MALNPDRRTSTTGNLSHGRGGAGNISTPAAPQLNPADLATPTIKSSTYTTGRGGTGNMASLDKAKPELARAAQDVEMPAGAHREPEGTFRYGRGGAANVAVVKEEMGRGAGSEGGLAVRRPSQGGADRSVVEKSKDLIGSVLGRTRSRQ